MTRAVGKHRVWWRRAALLMVWLIVTLAGFGLVHNSETAKRVAVDASVASRAEATARFVESYAKDVFTREQTLAADAFQADVPASTFSAQMRAAGFSAAVLLDARGRALAVFPADPSLVGTDFSGKYAHLDAALAGHATASGVVMSAVKHVPVVAFAVPFRSPTGDRVFSGAYPISATPCRRTTSYVGRGTT